MCQHLILSFFILESYFDDVTLNLTYAISNKMEKNILVCVIVGTTVLIMTIWVSVDFCFYRKRKRATREKQKWLFYNYGRRRRLAFPHSKEATGISNKPINKGKGKGKGPWKRLVSLFRSKKILEALSPNEQSITIQKDMKSDMTPSNVSVTIPERNNSSDNIQEERKVYEVEHKSGKLSMETTKKKNSITPSDILTPNRMALSPVEMASVFTTDARDDVLLYSPDFDGHSVSSLGSCSITSSVSESIKIDNETETTRLT